VNYPITLRASRLLSRWLTQAGSGSALAFVNGDFNVNDLRFDFDLGVGNFTSLGDLLDRHPDTGHGPIDGMCKYDRDRRVTARSLQVLDDDELFQHSDHNVYRGVWAVRSL
jgi:hypothetical protein